MANAVEQALLLHGDMADLRAMKKYEVFLSLKRDKKSAKTALYGAEKKVESQYNQLRQTKDQLIAAKRQIGALKKKLEEAKATVEKVELDGYDVGVAETEEALRAEVSRVCRTYYL